MWLKKNICNQRKFSFACLLVRCWDWTRPLEIQGHISLLSCIPAPQRLPSHFISSILEQEFDAKLKNPGDNKNVLKVKNRCRGLEGRTRGLKGSLSRQHSESLRKQSLGSRSWYPRMSLQKCLVGLLLSLTVWHMTWSISLLSLQSLPPECKASYNGFSFLEWREKTLVYPEARTRQEQRL